ncbi:MAG: hypothetical protein HC853_13945 [Anaerolineae bacterium]|nr:hypothetical protein [Anaerolineae bacterium]
MAADYITTVIVGKLHLARRRVMMDGRWAGAKFPAGYMVDMRKSLPNGERNPDWRNYVPFQPHADVIVEYYRMFLKTVATSAGRFVKLQKMGRGFQSVLRRKDFAFRNRLRYISETAQSRAPVCCLF